MNRLPACVFLFSAVLVPAVFSSQTALPKEWPQLYPEPTVATGFRQTGGAEFQWREGEWVPTTRHQNTFNAAGRLETVTQESETNGKWQPIRRETFRYVDGRPSEASVQESVGPSLRDRARHTYVYVQGRLTEETVDAWSFEQRWTLIRQHAFTYDPAGRRRHEEIRVPQSGPAAVRSRLEWRYDAAGRVNEEAKQRLQGNAWVDAERVTRLYGPGDRLAEVVMQAPGRGGVAWMDVFRVTHAYDAAGRRISVTTQAVSPAGLKDSARQVCAYDADGNQIETRHQGPRDGGWSDGRKETWTYERQREAVGRH